MVKILNSTFQKSDLKQVADNLTQMNAEERILLLIILEGFEDLFDVTLGYWDTQPVDLELKPYSSKRIEMLSINRISNSSTTEPIR